jgi:hypothetical protein
MKKEKRRPTPFDESKREVFRQAKKVLQGTSKLAYPQHTLLSEEELLKDIGLEYNPHLQINTSLEDIEFSEIGEYPLLVVLLDLETKQRSIKTLTLNIFPSKKKYALLKNVYWRAYGLVLEGQLSYSALDLYNEELHYTIELISKNGALFSLYPPQKHEKFVKTIQNGFHFIFETKDLETLEVGEYRFQVRYFDLNQDRSQVSRLIEKENPQFFSAHHLGHSLTAQLEHRAFKNKDIFLMTTKRGEVHLEVKKIDNSG